MATQTGLQSVHESGSLMGFGNLLRKDFGQWWQTRAWLIHLIIWTLLINGIVFAAVKTPVPEDSAGPAQDPVTTGVMLFAIMAGLTTGIGIIIVMQDAIIDEKKSGTAAWVLSKPVARPAFILSKLIANGLSALLVMIVVQSVLAYFLLTSVGGSFTIGNWIMGTLLLALHLLFYLTLTLMLGTFFDGRGGVIGIPMAILFLYQFVLGFAPQVGQIMPWLIVYPPGQTDGSLVQQALLGQPITMPLPIIATAVWCILFVVVAVWRFRREEF
ncbi:MAG: ABC transporter permease [Anaerolineae bacterium]|nr:ABC transporter permease [Anaerolineae bacterium]